MNIRTLLLAGATLVALGAPLTANAAEGGYGRDGYNNVREIRRDVSARGMLIRVDRLQREVTEGRREGWLGRQAAARVSTDLRQMRFDLIRAANRGGQLNRYQAERFDRDLDRIDRYLAQAERRDRGGRWGERDWRDFDHDGRGVQQDGRGDNDGRGGDRDGQYDRDGLRR